MESIQALHQQHLKYQKLSREMYWLSFINKSDYKRYHDAQIRFMKDSMRLADVQDDGAWIESPMELSKFYACIARINATHRNHLMIQKEIDIRALYGGRSVC